MSNQKAWENAIISIFGTRAQFGNDLYFLEREAHWYAVVADHKDIVLGRFEKSGNKGYIYSLPRLSSTFDMV